MGMLGQFRRIPLFHTIFYEKDHYFVSTPDISVSHLLQNDFIFSSGTARRDGISRDVATNDDLPPRLPLTLSRKTIVLKTWQIRHILNSKSHAVTTFSLLDIGTHAHLPLHAFTLPCPWVHHFWHGGNLTWKKKERCVTDRAPAGTSSQYAVYKFSTTGLSWWRHQMETFSALLAICAGNSPVIREFPPQRSVTRSFDVFFDLRPNKRLSRQSWGWRRHRAHFDVSVM